MLTKSKSKESSTIFATFLLITAATPMSSLLYPLGFTQTADQIIRLLVAVVCVVSLFATNGISWLEWSFRKFWVIYTIGVLAMASALWSTNPSSTFQRGFLLFSISFIGIYLGYRLDQKQLGKVIVNTVTILVVGSFIVALLFPQYGTGFKYGVVTDEINSKVGAWKGILAHKNSLGLLAGFLSAIAIFKLSIERIGRRANLIIFLISTFTLYKACSATAYMAFLFGIITVFLTRVGTNRNRYDPLNLRLILMLYTLVPIVIVLLLFPISLLELLGRNSSLTGRIYVWNYCIAQILSHPWLGIGYSEGFDIGIVTANYKESIFAHAHNVYLNLSVQLGIVAGSIASIWMFSQLFRACKHLHNKKQPVELIEIIFVYFFAMQILLNFFQVKAFDHKSLSWIIFITLAVNLRKFIDGAKEN